MALNAFNLLDGTEKWSKSSGDSSEISQTVFDDRGYLYFSHNGKVYGFDPAQIIDASWGSGKIFEAASIYNGNLLPVAIGNGAMYLSKGESIGKITY
jgi:outer membrane protein assembly factor BamB